MDGDPAGLDRLDASAKVEVLAYGLPPGLGSHVHWDRRLDARLAAALMGLPGFRTVELGDGFDIARVPGSAAHDEIVLEDDGFRRLTAHAGGVEGGMSTGDALRISGRVDMRALIPPSLGTASGTFPDWAATPRVAAVRLSCVAAESAVSLVLAEEAFRKFGNSSLTGSSDNAADYRKQLMNQFFRR
jgi:chorismate synthase